MTLGWLECLAIKHIEWSLRDLSELYILFVRNMKPNKVKHLPCCSHPAELVLAQLSGWAFPADGLLPPTPPLSGTVTHRAVCFLHSQLSQWPSDVSVQNTHMLSFLNLRLRYFCCRCSWDTVIRSHNLRINSQDNRIVSYSLANIH